MTIAAAVTTAGVSVLTLGAVRSPGALERLADVTVAAHYRAFVPDPADVAESSPTPREALRLVREMPGVSDAVVMLEVFVLPASSGLVPNVNLLTLAPDPEMGDEASLVDRPVVISGRLAEAADEVTINSRLAARLQLGVGDRLPLESMSPDYVRLAFSGQDPGFPDGPRVEARVVGITREPADFSRHEGVLRLSSDFVRRYGSEIGFFRYVHLRMPEPEDRARFESGRSDGPVSYVDVEDPIAVAASGLDEGLGTIANGLWGSVGVAGLAGVLVIGVLVGRVVRRNLSDRLALRALGFSRRQLVAGAAAVSAPAVALGIVIGTGLGVLLSPLALVGLARRVDPEPDSIVVAPAVSAAVVVASLVVGIAVVGATVATLVWRRTASVSRPFPLPVGRPLPLVLAVRRALGGDGRSSTTRSLLAAGTILAVASVGTLTIAGSIGRLQDRPELSGQGPERIIDSGGSPEVLRQVVSRLEADERVATLATSHVFFASAESGQEVQILAVEVLRGELALTVLDGRSPIGPDEIVVGPATANDLGVDVGGRVRLAVGEDDEGKPASSIYRVVGMALFPAGDFKHDTGIGMTTAAATALIGNPIEQALLHTVVFDWADGVDAEAADADLADEDIKVFTSADDIVPPEVTNLGEVESLAVRLGLILGLLVAAVAAQALAASARDQRPEHATLRALGVRPRTMATMLGLQALAGLILVVAVGLAAGLAAGSVAWEPIARRSHLVVSTAVPWNELAGLAGLVGLTVTIATAAVAAFGRQLLRSHPAHDLRQE